MSATLPPSPWRSWRRQRWVVTGVAVVLAILAALIITGLNDGSAPAAVPPPTPAPQTVRAGTTLSPLPVPTCATGASKPFVPTRIMMAGVITPAPVLALARDWRGVPSVAPISAAGMHEFAWDKGPVGILPGSSQGNALFNAHTWPWPAGGALGNDMLLRLRPGKVIVLHGKGVTQCYRVTKQIQVPAQSEYPGFYERTGPPQIAIIVCSGVRAGPGDWLSRTIWFASPFTEPSTL
ncbi:MAG: class F sortase [Marmoricola sp.]